MTNHYAEVISGLWIGDGNAPLDEDFLETNFISQIVDLTKDYQWTSSTLKVLGIKLDDSEYFTKSGLIQLKIKIDAAVNEIFLARSNQKNVLVHCQMGINRSALIIATYLIRYEHYSYVSALECLDKANQKRGQRRTLQNQFFRDLLQEVKTIKNSSS